VVAHHEVNTVKLKTVFPLIVALALFVLGIRIGRRDQHGSEKSRQHEVVRQAVHVTTLIVQPKATQATIDVTGTVKASLTADVAPKIMSKVAAVHVKEGDRVRKGQTLVRLESADLVSQVRQAEAAVSAAEAALSQAQTGAKIQFTQSSTRVEQARSAVAQAEAQLSLVKEGARKQQKTQADEGVRQVEAAEQQAAQGVKQAEAGVVAAKEQLSLVREGARQQQKRQADAAVQQAEAGLKTAQATYNRFRPLAAEGVITQQRFDEISLQLEIAKGQYEAAKQQASLVYEGGRTQEVRQAEEGVRQAEAGVKIAQERHSQAEAAVRSSEAQRDLTYEGSRAQEIRQAEEQVRQARENLRMATAGIAENTIKVENVKMLRSQVSQAQAALSAARVVLGYANISAPFSGVITRRRVDPGTMASPGVPVMSLVDDSGFRLEAIVPESRILRVQLGDAAEVTIDALSRNLTGQVAQVVPSADPASRTFIVKISLPKSARLTAGMFGRASIVAGESKGLHVPENAVWREGSLTGVYVIERDIAHKRLVTLGKSRDGSVEALAGLQAGEEIVIDGIRRVRDGVAVHHGGDPL